MSEHEPHAPENGTPAQPADKKDPKVIKRYTNRKLYDTVESRYVTLDEIAQMIKGGAEVKIIDNRSKEDLTSVTLAQIIFEEEKKRSQMPLGALREIIRHGGESLASVGRGAAPARHRGSVVLSAYRRPRRPRRLPGVEVEAPG